MLLFDGFAEETLTVQRLPGFFRQRDNMLYSAAAYVWPTTIIRIPYSLLCALLWCAPLPPPPPPPPPHPTARARARASPFPTTERGRTFCNDVSTRNEGATCTIVDCHSG